MLREPIVDEVHDLVDRRVLSPDPEGNGAKRTMQRALSDSGIHPEEVSYINAHANANTNTNKLGFLSGSRTNPAEVAAIVSWLKQQEEKLLTKVSQKKKQ